MSSLTFDPPCEVANLCSNCEKVQFRDEITALSRSGPHLDRLDLHPERLPEGMRGSHTWRQDTGGLLPTEFALTDAYPELPELTKSSQDGCDFCRFLHEIIVSFASQDIRINKIHDCTMTIQIQYSWAMRRPDGLEISRQSLNGLDAMLIAAKFSSDEIEYNELTLRVVCHVESACDSDTVSRWLRLPNRSNQEYCDAVSVQWMKQTLEACEKTHSHEVFDRAYIPERIIDVRPEVARLILREDHIQAHCASTLKYAALSYCWGSAENQAKTTVATLSDRRAGITEAELPPVIREAIQVTRALGIPFLWVDALCILQDDPSDWERQCTEMHNIYGSAQVTLCAANSRSCDEGFLRQSGRIIRIPFQSHRAPDIEGSFLVQYKGVESRGSNLLGVGCLYSDTSWSRWGKRGWVYQEQVLSTRRLIFGARDLYFLCSKCHQRRGQDALPGAFGYPIGKSEIEKDLEIIHKIWDRVSQSYSIYETDSFTHPTDILPALSGLAQLLHGRLKDDYYAGHWGRNLYRSLLWTKGGSHPDGLPCLSSRSRPRSEAFIAPSWSFLNKGYTEGFLDYTNFYGARGAWYDCRSEIKLIKGKALLAGANPFGVLAGCSLRLRGYMLDLSHKEVDARDWIEGNRRFYSLLVYGRHFGTLTFDCKPEPRANGEKCVSEVEVGKFKLLLLLRCDYHVPRKGYRGEFIARGPPHRRWTWPCERDYAEIESGGGAIPDAQQERRGELDGREDSGRQEQMSGEEAAVSTDNTSDGSQSQQSKSRSSASVPLRTVNTVRKGFGLILYPTGNDGEFYRVGVFSPANAYGTINDLGGDIRELHRLAQVETVQLV